MSGPSEKAVDAAYEITNPGYTDTGEYREIAQEALEAAHDPALGLDRSVCLRDVVEWLRTQAATSASWPTERLPELAERQFGGKS